jgi:hypothetical protein
MNMLTYFFIAACFLSAVYAAAAKRRHDDVLEVLQSIDRSLHKISDEAFSSRIALDDIQAELKNATGRSFKFPS